MNETFCNITITVANRKIAVHSVLLAEASDVFVAVMNSDFKEKEDKQYNIQDFDYDVVFIGITFLYKRTLEGTKCTVEQLRFSGKYNDNIMI